MDCGGRLLWCGEEASNEGNGSAWRLSLVGPHGKVTCKAGGWLASNLQKLAGGGGGGQKLRQATWPMTWCWSVDPPIWNYMMSSNPPHVQIQGFTLLSWNLCESGWPFWSRNGNHGLWAWMLARSGRPAWYVLPKLGERYRVLAHLVISCQSPPPHKWSIGACAMCISQSCACLSISCQRKSLSSKLPIHLW